MSISSRTLRFVADLIRREAGIIVSQEKDYLVEARLAPIARTCGHRDVDSLVSKLQVKPDPLLYEAIVDAMTTNETTFFRDLHPFEALREHLLPEAIERNQKRRTLTIWSAAASTGQEAYTVAMIIADDFPDLARWKVRIVASDISEKVLESARVGRYAQHEVNRGLPASKLVKHFRQEGRDWVLNDAIRQRVEFRRVNLIEAFPHWLPTFDIVLLRNVLIYFDPATKAEILARTARQLEPDGMLMLGAAETTIGAAPPFERVRMQGCSVYRVIPPPGRPTAARTSSLISDHGAL